MNEIEKKKISKFLSLILRHQPESIAIKLDENGWADIDELRAKSAKKRMFFTPEELAAILPLAPL